MGGTTFPDQRDRLGATTEQMGRVVVVIVPIALASSFVNGIIADVAKQKVMILC